MALGRSLFRQEAIEFQRGQREFGEIGLLQPVSTKLLAWLLAAIVTIAVVFLCFAQFSRKQTVAGFLMPAAGTLKVFPDREGVVTNLYVKEGQQVKAGDPLFTVGTPQIAADGEDVNAAKLASLKQQKEALRDQISEVQQRAAESKGRSSYVVRAPADGRISMSQVSLGQTVQPQRLQMEIVPDGTPLRAELLIPTRAAGFVHVGEEVRFQYDAFPYQNFGTYTGRIVELSHTVLTKTDAAGPVVPEEPVYKAIAALDRDDVDANGRKAVLQSGMLLKAEIILDRRSLADWILDPLLHKRM